MQLPKLQQIVSWTEVGCLRSRQKWFDERFTIDITKAANKSGLFFITLVDIVLKPSSTEAATNVTVPLYFKYSAITFSHVYITPFTTKVFIKSFMQ